METKNKEHKAPTIDDLVSLCRKTGNIEISRALREAQRYLIKRIRE